MTRIRFYRDEHVHPSVTAGLRRRGVDVLTTQEAGMLHAADHDHLSLAIKTGRVVFTQDEDFLNLHASGMTHCGIVYVPQQTSIGYIVRNLMLIYDVLAAEEMLNHLEYL